VLATLCSKRLAALPLFELVLLVAVAWIDDTIDRVVNIAAR
jgi:hypothetical protein